MIKYIGSKRVIVPQIASIVAALPNVRRICDLFAGTTRVGQALKGRGLYVVSNDLASYSEVLGRAYIQADARKVDRSRLLALLTRLHALSPQAGYFTRTFCEEARYFQPHNGAKIDAIRSEIDRIAESAEEHAILLTSLLLAADRVDSTTGLQMAYLKDWAPRSYQPLTLRLPELLPGPGIALRRGANDLARDLDDVDLVYVDPPYNQHSYFSNYHIWETLVRNDRPETYGIARKRVDCREIKSCYNQKNEMQAAFADLIANVHATYLLVSFNDEGYLNTAAIQGLLRQRGYLASVAVDFKRYVGAQIGIFNPQGQKVGRISHLRNHEYLFLVGPSAHVVETAMAAVQQTVGLRQEQILFADEPAS
ncbi:MAG: DNA adenine methylase [Chloroflexi bacterium]|nr:DNA adenine methylase [Chloroflexota bacterium]